MTRSKVFLNAVLLSSSVGTITEAVLAGAYAATFPNAPIVLVTVIGGLMGLALGIFNGVLVGAMTNYWFTPTKNGFEYRLSLGLATTLLSLVMILIVAVVIFWFFAGDSTQIDLQCLLSQAVLAVSMGLTSQLFAHWYIKKSQRVGSQQK